MPFPFVLPTTSAFSFSSSFSSDSHPSLPLNASTYRGVVRDTLKKHKRLPPHSQAPNLSTILQSVNGYLPYLFAVDAGLNCLALHGEDISVGLRGPLKLEWRPALSAAIPGKENARVKVQTLEHELAFALSTLANTHTLMARVALQPLYLTTTAPIGSTERQTAIAGATKHLLDAASVYDYLATRADHLGPGTPPVPAPDIAAATLRGQSALALAEATLLAVLKDDPYPAVVAQDRNANDREWMYKAPDVPKVRAHLFARLCLAASEHAAKAHSLCATAAAGRQRLNDGFVRYLEDLRRTSRAKACRFFGIDAELGGQTGAAIGWLHAGLQELGVEVRAEGKKSSGFSRLKKEWSEKREDKKVERGVSWGADGGKMEETRIIEFLEAKWTKQNDTVSPSYQDDSKGYD